MEKPAVRGNWHLTKKRFFKNLSYSCTFFSSWFLFIHSILRCDNQLSANASLASCRTSLPTAEPNASRRKLGDFACALASSFCLSHLPPFRKANHGLITHSSYSHEDDEFVRYLSQRCVSLTPRSKLFLPFPSPKIRSTITAKPKRTNESKVGPKRFKRFKKVQNDLKANKKIDLPLDQQHSSSPDIYFCHYSYGPLPSFKPRDLFSSLSQLHSPSSLITEHASQLALDITSSPRSAAEVHRLQHHNLVLCLLPCLYDHQIKHVVLA